MYWCHSVYYLSASPLLYLYHLRSYSHPVLVWQTVIARSRWSIRGLTLTVYRYGWKIWIACFRNLACLLAAPWNSVKATLWWTRPTRSAGLWRLPVSDAEVLPTLRDWLSWGEIKQRWWIWCGMDWLLIDAIRITIISSRPGYRQPDVPWYRISRLHSK